MAKKTKTPKSDSGLYVINEIEYHVARTYPYDGDLEENQGVICVRLESADGKYSYITDADSFSKMAQEVT